MSGYATNQQVSLLDRLLPQLEPDLVLFAFYWNDLLMGGSTKRGRAKLAEASTRFSDTASVPRERLHMTGSGPWWDRSLRKSRAAFVAGRGLKRVARAGESMPPHASLEDKLLQGGESEDIARRWRRFETEAEKIAALTRQSGSSAGILAMPSRRQTTGDFPNAQIQSKLKKIAGRFDMFVLDLLPPFQQRGMDADSLYIPYDQHHPSAAGHGLIAEYVASSLRAGNRLALED